MFLLLLSLNLNYRSVIPALCQYCKVDSTLRYPRGFVRNKLLEKKYFRNEEDFYNQIFAKETSYSQTIRKVESQIKSLNSTYGQENPKFKKQIVDYICLRSDLLKELLEYPKLFIKLFKARSEVIETLVEKLDCKYDDDRKFLRDFGKKLGINCKNYKGETIALVAKRLSKNDLINFLNEQEEINNYLKSLKY